MTTYLSDLVQRAMADAEERKAKMTSMLAMLSQPPDPMTQDLGATGYSSTDLGNYDYQNYQTTGSSNYIPWGDPRLVTRHGITLQKGAMQSLLDIARASDLMRGAREIGQIGQGWRSWEAQQAAYNAYLNGTGNQAAPPGQSYHGAGLAIDAGWWSDQEELARALAAAGWNRFSPSGEPWHWSYGVTG